MMNDPAALSQQARVIAIGDVHGCSLALRTLLEAIQPQREDTIITLGDCVDRGLDTRAVIDQLLELRGECRLVPIMGNHEEMMLSFLDGRVQADDWLAFGGDATVASYVTVRENRALPQNHEEFIRSWGDFWETDAHFFVHGGYHPEQPFAGQRWRVWRWHSLRQSVPAPHVSGKTAIVGHTAQKNGEILDVDYLKCIDTYCYGGGWLTALEPATGQIWQADREGRMRVNS